MEQLSDNSHLESIPPATKRSPSLLRTTTMSLMAMALIACDNSEKPKAADYNVRMLQTSGARPVYDTNGKHVLDKDGKVTWEFPQYNSDGTFKRDSDRNIIYGLTPPASIESEKSKNTNISTE